MANMFALILALATLVTGIIWCFERFKWAPARRAKIAAVNEQTSGAVDDKTLAKVAKQPGWVETGASVFPVLLLVFVVRSFIYEPFQIPSGSMMPTLLIGDFILVEKYAYGIKDPITQTTLIETGHPKRGDIAVFKYPLDPKLDYIKRVIGLPGDRITYDPVNKRVTVQPSCNSGQSCDTALAVTYADAQPSDFVQLFSRSGMGEASNGLPNPAERQRAAGRHSSARASGEPGRDPPHPDRAGHAGSGGRLLPTAGQTAGGVGGAGRALLHDGRQPRQQRGQPLLGLCAGEESGG